MFELYENPEWQLLVNVIRILKEQSYDSITSEENEALNNVGLKSAGVKGIRDVYCSEKINF